MPLLAFLRPNVPEHDGYVACVGRVPLVVWLQYVLFLFCCWLPHHVASGDRLMFAVECKSKSVNHRVHMRSSVMCSFHNGAWASKYFSAKVAPHRPCLYTDSDAILW